MCLCVCKLRPAAYFSLSPSKHTSPLLISSNMTEPKMLLLYSVRANKSVPVCFGFFFFFEALQGELVLVYGREEEGAPDTVVNMLLSGFYHLQLFCAAAGVPRRSGLLMESEHGSSEAFYFPHGHIGPGLSTPVRTITPQHILFKRLTTSEKHCVTFFFVLFFCLTTQGNGCGKLVGWNILEVGGCKYQLS